MKSKVFFYLLLIAAFLYTNPVFSQQQTSDSLWKNTRKNIIRYNLSGALLFGFDKYIIFGYERVIKPHQSFSINVGGAGLPKLVSITSDSFQLQKDTKNSGFNISADYRFYLPNENKYNAPHGLYIGPYISYNQFDRNNEWSFQESSSNQKIISTEVKFNIFTAGAELGYQFVFWKRVTLDMVLIGPGISGYNLKGKVAGDLTDEQRSNLQEALKQLISQKFPGMNYVFADKEFNANGVINTTSIGFRYLIHIGFNF
ncbi:MAG TPA: DUF3575 domain-containing protein [Parafilimonas sp.]|nr:DUF3575 domain-containing protein [Parafilimonas sp.]